MAEVPRAVADVDLGVVQIVGRELGAARAERDPLRRRRLKLHQADRARRGLGVGLELALLVDDRGQKRRLELVVARVRTDDRLVVEWIAEALQPGGLAVLD